MWQHETCSCVRLRPAFACVAGVPATWSWSHAASHACKFRRQRIGWSIAHLNPLVTKRYVRLCALRARRAALCAAPPRGAAGRLPQGRTGPAPRSPARRSRHAPSCWPARAPHRPVPGPSSTPPPLRHPLPPTPPLPPLSPPPAALPLPCAAPAPRPTSPSQGSRPPPPPSRRIAPHAYGSNALGRPYACGAAKFIYYKT